MFGIFGSLVNLIMPFVYLILLIEILRKLGKILEKLE